jgi:GT2 family glycosyltransferase
VKVCNEQPPVINPQASNQPHVYIVVLNWNGWRDTIECLESVFRLNYPRFTVLVCDNASTDGSLEKIQDWARGNVMAGCSSPDLSRLITPPILKPIAFFAISAADGATTQPSPDVRLVLIQTGANLGFAGGNNVGIRYALSHGHRDYVWLLNNDTVVDPHSLSALVRMAQADQMLGICGSLIRNYGSPHDVQSVGRRYSPWSGRTRPFQELATAKEDAIVSGRPGYIVEGASMLVSGKFLDRVGLLEESYFLFFEELDWITRALPIFHFGYSAASIVYHKVGKSVGSSIVRTSRSVLSDFYQARNRLVFTARHHPGFFPSVLVAVSASALQRVVIGKPKNAVAIMRGVIASFKYVWSPRQATH